MEIQLAEAAEAQVDIYIAHQQVLIKQYPIHLQLVLAELVANSQLVAQVLEIKVGIQASLEAELPL